MLAQKLILSYATKIIVQLIQMVATIVVARIAGPTVLGTVAYGLAFVSMFLFIADLGVGTAHIKLVSEGQDLGKCNSTYTTIRLSTIALYVLVVLSVYLFQNISLVGLKVRFMKLLS